MSKSGMTKDLTQGGIPQRASAYFLDERTNPLANEDTYLTLMSMLKFYEGDETRSNALKDVAREEGRYMAQAAMALHGVPKTGADAEQKKNFNHNQAVLRRKFGRDMGAVAELSKVLKNKIEDKETEDILLGVARGLERDDTGKKLSGALEGKAGGLTSILQ